MTIISQDRDFMVSYKRGDSVKIQNAIYNNKIIGLNLFINNKMIGTFDNIQEIIYEIKMIYNCTYPIYVVNGFSEYNNERKILL